jgi:hypothetical protein
MRRGSHFADEQKAKISAALKAKPGHPQSPETRAKIAAARKGKPGHPQSPETRAKIAAVNKGKRFSPETRTKISAAKEGHTVSPETRAKVSAAKVGHTVVSLEARKKISAKLWNGGSQASNRRAKAKRRTLGFVLLNEPFPGCEGHHVDKEQVIYMPKELHRSVYHRQSDGRSMAKMNAIAYSFLKQEVERTGFEGFVTSAVCTISSSVWCERVSGSTTATAQ